jgi:hypothetical protein
VNPRVSGAGIARWLVLFAAAMMSGGCPFFIPTPGVQENAPAAEVVQAIKPQTTTRTDVLMMLGDPNFRLEEDRYFVYDWNELHAIYGLAMPWGDPIAAGVGGLGALAMEFAPDGRVARVKQFSRPDRKNAESELWGEIRAWMKASDAAAR